MKKTLLAIGLSIGMVTAAWGASEITNAAGSKPVISTGSKSGTYFRVGNNIARMIGGTVIKSKGGQENIERIAAGKATVGLTQIDTYAYMSSKDPSINSTVEIMGPLYQEAVYIVGNCKGKVQDEDDLQKEGVTIATGKAGSGGASTWDYMRELEPGYKKAAVDPSGGIRALGKLASQPDGEIDAVLFVSKPVLEGKLVNTVMNNDSLCFIDVNDKDLNDKHPQTGKPIYRFCKIDVAKGVFNDKEVHTICMDAVVIAATDADEDYLDSLSDAVLNYVPSLLK